ncbi:Dihydroorotate dehydrogenase (quinone), mitochondrial [Thelotrema lepadinum]|nr:Dihydroorotate dehydrogenase (quinone), mitochondrial [Thelotrema lepadinum]
MYITDARANFYTWLADPLTRIIWPNADDAHTAGIRSLEALYRYNLHPRERGNSFQDLEVKVFGYILDNPIGISAGLDKNGSIISPLFELGPALVEIGGRFFVAAIQPTIDESGITPYPQEGNPKPRIFRIPSQQSLINRCGMNSEGAAAVASRLQQRRKAIVRQDGHDSEDVLNGTANVPTGSLIKGKLLAIQIAKQETTPEHDITAIQRDFILCTKALAEHADIIVLNVSCPNGRYRHLQQAEYLTAILNGVVTAARQVKVRTPPAVMVKVSPDYDDSEQIRNICKAVHASHTDGIVVGNSTTRRPVPLDARLSKADATNMLEKGGFSGPALFDKTLYLVRQYRRTLDDEAYISRIGGQTMSEPKVIFCTGGVVNGSQALEVLKAGASLAQVYTGQKITAVQRRNDAKTSQLWSMGVPDIFQE